MPMKHRTATLVTRGPRRRHQVSRARQPEGNARLAFVAVLVGLTLAGCSGAATVSHTGSMLAARDQHTATLLADGRVLITGGRPGDINSPSLASAEIYDPKAGTFTATGSMTTPRSFHTATLLSDGRVLIAGGEDASNPPNDLASAELFDLKAGTFSPTGSMGKPRSGQSATLLKDGRVLLIDDFGTSADLYDPKTGVFTPTGPMSRSRHSYTATLLSDGRVLITGGDDENFNPMRSAELYDPGSGTFMSTGSMTTPRDAHSATLLKDGRVLIAGGDVTLNHILATAELYDPATGAFAQTGSMVAARDSHTATLLSGGRVLLAGGSGQTSDPNGLIVASAELYDPNTGTFSATGSMSMPRYQDTATLLADGRVLVAGGSSLKKTLASAEVYNPNSGTFGPAD
jgi:hypothetical protein